MLDYGTTEFSKKNKFAPVLTTFLIRFFDVIVGTIMLLLIFPFLVILSVVMLLNQGFPILFSQTRMGRNFKPFQIYKLRTMNVHSEDHLGLTRGSHDQRITKIGFFLRKYKIDELPQVVNILKGEMSLVGSRPQVPFYTQKFKIYYDIILEKKPGIFSQSAIMYSNEDEILDREKDPISYYENVLIPIKCKMDIKMVSDFSVKSYFAIILQYLNKLFNN